MMLMVSRTSSCDGRCSRTKLKTLRMKSERRQVPHDNRHYACSYTKCISIWATARLNIPFSVIKDHSLPTQWSAEAVVALTRPHKHVIMLARLAEVASPCSATSTSLSTKARTSYKDEVMPTKTQEVHWKHKNNDQLEAVTPCFLLNFVLKTFK